MVYQRLWFVGCDSGVDEWYIKDCGLSVVTVEVMTGISKTGLSVVTVESMSGISKTVVCRL